MSIVVDFERDQDIGHNSAFIRNGSGNHHLVKSKEEQLDGWDKPLQLFAVSGAEKFAKLLVERGLPRVEIHHSRLMENK